MPSVPGPRPTDDHELLQRVRALDAELVAPSASSTPTEGEPVEKLFERLAATEAAVRESAAEQLGLLGDARAVSPLRAAAADVDARVRSAAVASLVRLGRDTLLPEIVKGLRHEDPRVVVGAAVVLGRVGDRAAVPNLVEAFKTDDPTVGAAVAWALGRCDERAVVPWLVAALEQRFAAAQAAEALGSLGDERAWPALSEALAAEDPEVRAAAARALGRICLAPHVTPRVVAVLEPLSRDPVRRVRLCAALALFELGEGGAQLARALDEK